jgi:hypothetical protein
LLDAQATRGYAEVVRSRETVETVAAITLLRPDKLRGGLMFYSNSAEQGLAYRFAALALPDDATDCYPWQWHREDDWRRGFLVREWDVGAIWVSVAGEQDHRGYVSRWLHVSGDDECTPPERRQLMAALSAAGELLDSLAA